MRNANAGTVKGAGVRSAFGRSREGEAPAEPHAQRRLGGSLALPSPSPSHGAPVNPSTLIRPTATFSRREKDDWRRLLTMAALISMLLLSYSPIPAPAQATPKAESLFDDDGADAPKETRPAEGAKPTAVTDRDEIGFTQENVAAQMNELEERMFRLSEALQNLEPENASRLKLALKFSREELILQQMKETQQLLKNAQLSKAETEVREMLAKLDHLRRLLLAEDLDFQMKLARLRQLRETANQLQRIVGEERRELAWSRKAVEIQADSAKLADLKAKLEALVKDQKAVVEETQKALEKADDIPAEAREASRAKEIDIQKRAAELAEAPPLADLQPPYLKEADPHLTDVEAHLKGGKAREAAGSAETALTFLQRELDRLAERIDKQGKAVAKTEFEKFEQEQTRNRKAADSLAAASARLGNPGVSLQKDLIRASGAMGGAETELGRTAAEPAADKQDEALKHLVKSQDDLNKGIESLLVEIRSELQARILAELAEMHEIQVSIRETTEAQADRVKTSRAARLLVTGLAPKEKDLADRVEQLRLLTEETGFGVALPTALRVIDRQMLKVQELLAEADASRPTVELEKRVEEDLLALAEAMRRLPPSSPPPPGSPLPTDLRARERELNRLVAELKMIRLLQSRLNDDTIETDQSRPAEVKAEAKAKTKKEVLTPDLRRAIEALTTAQNEIHETLSILSKRFEEPAPQPEIPGFPGALDR